MWHVRAAMLKLSGADAKPATSKRRLTITRFYGGPQKARDKDNLVTSFKPAVDALVKHRLLVDDSAKGVDGPYYKQVRCAKGQPSGVLFEVEVLQTSAHDQGDDR